MFRSSQSIGDSAVDFPRTSCSEPFDRGERGAQLVSDRAQEVALQSRELAGLTAIVKEEAATPHRAASASAAGRSAIRTSAPGSEVRELAGGVLLGVQRELLEIQRERVAVRDPMRERVDDRCVLRRR